MARPPQKLEELLRRNSLLHDEVRVARRASEITAELVVEQFAKMEEGNRRLQAQAAIELHLKNRLAEELREAEAREVELETARRAAEAASRTKSTFLANMSHELRTPLNAIIGYAELVAEELADQTNSAPSVVPDLERISRAGKHLLALINDVLDLSKIEAGKIVLYREQISVRKLVDEVVATIRPLLERPGNRLEVRCEPAVGDFVTDPMRLRQCLLNLLSNANKFTERGRIGLTITPQTKSGLRFDVRDTGIGISPEHLDRLYEPFTQADTSSTRKYSGTGLGLTITKHFTELLGGKLEVVSQLGRGSTFSIILPSGQLDAER